MLKFPLLCSKLEKTATLLLFGVLLSLSMPGMQAIAGEDSAAQLFRPNSPEPAAEKPCAGSTAAEAAKPTAARQ